MLHCYYMNVNCDCSFEQSQAFYRDLPKERQERISRMKASGLARKKLIAWGFLQSVLYEVTGIEPGKQEFTYNNVGRPFLAGKSDIMDFNMSDSGDYVVLAVSDQRVGIDVERRKKDYLAIARRCFCPEEYEAIQTVTGIDQDRLFLRYWTMKEAYVKYEGRGLSIPLNSFLVDWRSEERNTSIIIPSNSQEDCMQQGIVAYGETFFLDEKYCVSVCQRGNQDKAIEVEERTICSFRK